MSATWVPSSPANSLLPFLIFLLSQGACAPTVPKTSTPKRLVIVVLDQFRADYITRLRLPALAALSRRGAVFENAFVGHLPATTVISHQVIPRGLFPRHLAWSDDLHRDTGGLLGPRGGIHDPGEFDLDRMRQLLAPVSRTHVARIFQGRGRFVAVGQKRYAVFAMAAGASGSHGPTGPGDLIVTLSDTLKEGNPFGEESVGWVHPVGLNVPAGLARTPRSRFWLDTRPAYGTENAVYRLNGHRTVPGPDPERPGGDAWVVDAAMHLMEREPWAVAMLTLGAVDRVGHMYGAQRDLDQPNGSQVHMKDTILQADAQVGRLVAFLKEKGWDRDTILVVTADHAGMGASDWHGRDQPGASWGNWAWGQLENAQTVAQIRPQLAPLVDAGLRALYSDTALRLYLKPGADLERILAITRALPGVVLVARKDKTPGGFRYTPVFSEPARLSPIERRWFEAMVPGLLDTWACERGPDMIALLDERTSWGQPGDHGGAQHAVQAIPMIIAGPGIPAGHITAAARLVDLAPTLWDLFGRTPPAPMDGVSLGPALSTH